MHIGANSTRPPRGATATCPSLSDAWSQRPLGDVLHLIRGHSEGAQDARLYGKLVRADANVRAAVAMGGTFATSLVGPCLSN